MLKRFPDLDNLAIKINAAQRKASTSPRRMPVKSDSIAGTYKRPPLALSFATRPGTSWTITISSSGTFGAGLALATFLATNSFVKASLRALDRTNPSLAIGVRNRIGRPRLFHPRARPTSC